MKETMFKAATVNLAMLYSKLRISTHLGHLRWRCNMSQTLTGEWNVMAPKTLVFG